MSKINNKKIQEKRIELTLMERRIFSEINSKIISLESEILNLKTAREININAVAEHNQIKSEVIKDVHFNEDNIAFFYE